VFKADPEWATGGAGKDGRQPAGEDDDGSGRAGRRCAWPLAGKSAGGHFRRLWVVGANAGG
ncbi:hypothetical protein VWT34_13885, partial [Xanthomonas citri pv. citri]